jgi:nitroreductase
VSADRDRLLRIVFSALNDIEEWRLGDPERAARLGYPRRRRVETLDDFGVVFVDVTLDAASGRPVCHEVNGPNGVGSDALTGESGGRADNEARQAARRAREAGLVGADGRLARPVATVHAHQHWGAFRTGGEFYPRVARFAERLEAHLPGNAAGLYGPGEAVGDEPLAVVLGDVPSVAAGLRVQASSGRFEHQGRPVIFLGNPNLVPELVRTRKLGPGGFRGSGFDRRAFHAGQLLPVLHDKGLQQALLEGTGIAPLRHFAAASEAEALRATCDQLARGPVVLKPNATSGGVGVHVAVPGMSEAEIAQRIAALVADCAAKYGENAEATLFPIRGFEFVRSTGYAMADGEHLWDLRVAVLFEPGEAQLFPVSLRVAPRAFDPRRFHLDRDQWISNLSGREGRFLLSGMDEKALLAVGLTPERLEEIFDACLRWTAKAWDAAARDGGPAGAVYEDACEREDPGFYPVEKFRVPQPRGAEARAPAAPAPSAAPSPEATGGKRVATRHPVLPLLAERWSARSFAARPIEPALLASLFEAARLAPSAHNTQPARFLVARRGVGDTHARLFACLDAHNHWAERAPVLVLAATQRERFSQATSGMVPYPHGTHDLGLAVMSLLIQAQALGLHAHPMAAFDPERARAAFAIPPLFEPMLVIALGYLGDPDALPGDLRARELAPRTRRPLEELVFEGTWGEAAGLFAPER